MAVFDRPHVVIVFGVRNGDSARSDEVVDTLWGGAAADAFFGAPPDNAAD